MEGKKNQLDKNVLIVGAGVGGLATALRLTSLGYHVTIVEKHHQAGGRLNRLEKDGFTFDVGPSFFSMSYEFKDFFKACGMEMPFKAIELDPLYSVNIAGSNKVYHMYKDVKKLAPQFTDVEPDFEERMNNYLKKTAKLFDDTFDPVIKNNFNGLPDYLTKLAKVNLVHVPVLTRTFWNEIKKHFTSKEARQIISLVGFFLGRTPFDTLGVYSLLSHVEFTHDGYYNVQGGMYTITQSMVNELQKRNVTFSYNTEIVGFKTSNKKLTALIDQNGNAHNANVFVINSDAAYFRGKVFERKKFNTTKLNAMNWTMGYLTIYLGINCKLPQVNHHNYYLGTNYEAYKKDVKHLDLLGEKPYYYVNVLSTHNPNCAPPNCESLFFVCPVPNLATKANWDDRNEIAQTLIADFEKRIGQSITQNIVTQTVYTPLEWQQQFNLYNGSGLSLSPSMWQIGAFRPKNVDEEFANTFYVGASTVPGSGIPMAIISSDLVTKRVVAYNG
jgi:phytoene desaturase